MRFGIPFSGTVLDHNAQGKSLSSAAEKPLISGAILQRSFASYQSTSTVIYQVDQQQQQQYVQHSFRSLLNHLPAGPAALRCWCCSWSSGGSLCHSGGSLSTNTDCGHFG